MTISSQTRKAGPFTGNSVTVDFPFSFKCFSSADLRVVLTDSNGGETDLTLTSQYTVALNADQNASAGGTVTALTTYSSSYKITIVGDVDYTQEIDITNGGGFYPEVIESALDKITMQMQQVNEKADRSVKVDVSSGVSPEDYLTTVDAYRDAAEAAATAAAASEAAADVSEAAAAASAAATAAIYDNFDDRFLGPKSSAPTVDNDGNALQTGAMYLNTVSNDMYVRTSAGSWATINNVTAATNAANSATAAAASAADALTSANNADTSEAAAAASASAADTSEAAAAASATAAGTSETNADTSEANAATSATNAANSAAGAATSATNSANSATAAAGSATNAANSATTATAKAGEASTSATNAASSATASANSATAADASAAAAAISETNAASSASAASGSAVSAASSATAAAAAYDLFDDRFLGAKASAPSVDNDGNTLLTGAIYWNTTVSKLYIWTGLAWNQAAFDTTGAVLSFNTRTGAVTLTSTDVTDALGFTPANYADSAPHFSGSVTVDGNLTVLGTTVTINTTNLAVEDNMIYLNNGSTVTNPDLGFAGNYNDGVYRHAGVFRDATDGRWKFYHQYTLEPDASPYIDTSHASFAFADIQANHIYANLTGNVTGNADTVTNGLYTADLGVSVQAYSANISTVLSAQAEMEVGSESAIRSMSPLRIKQAIVANAPQAFPAGTTMLFVQTAAPIGWTKSTTHDNKALRIVSGVAGSGGSVAFTSAFTSQTPSGSVSVSVGAGTLAVGIGSLSAAATTLSTAQIPSHTHSVTTKNPSTSPVTGIGHGGDPSTGPYSTNATGGGGSHSHSMSGSPSLSGAPSVTSSSFTGGAINLAVQYVDAIIAVKD